MAYDDAPSDEVFNEIKQAAIEIWQTYDNTYGYVDEKLESIKHVQNVRDNWGYLVGMFDAVNQRKLYIKLSDEARSKVKEWLF